MERKEITSIKEIVKSLHVFCHLKFRGVIRLKTLPTMGIRFMMHAINTVGTPSISLVDISEKGRAFLKNEKNINIEIIGMQQRLMFSAMILSLQEDKVIIELPRLISSEERRANMRMPTTKQYAAFCRFMDFRHEATEITHPPFFTAHTHLSNLVLIKNISTTGLMAETMFPAIHNFIEEQRSLRNMELLLPMEAPATFSGEITWNKLINERVVSPYGERTQIKYRIGLRYTDISTQLIEKIEVFKNQLAVASAI